MIRGMVRRDGAMRWLIAPRCLPPTGASPVSVSAGAPSSRPQARDESPAARAGCRKSPRREQARGPQHQVKPAASTDSQSESRAGHVAAKATHSPRSRPGSGLGLPGVRAAARFDRTVRNTRDPSRRPTSGGDRAHKAGAESARSRAGVRGAHSTGEGGDKPLEGRGPAMVALVTQARARACP